MEKMTRQDFIDKCKKGKPVNKRTGLSISATLEEREIIRKAAKNAGLNITNYIRSRLFFD